MSAGQDEGFRVSRTDTPIAQKLLDSLVKNEPKYATYGQVEADRALLGEIGYHIGAIAELERRVVALEEIVRQLMSR